jgi:amino acid adenylation domain-containing protein
LYKRHFASECILVNLMGSTESSLNQLYFMNQQTVVTRYAVSLGYPVEDTLVQLLNQDGEVSDFYGEIGVKSRHVALGYWQNPELTQAAFLGAPGGDEPRLYRTGDLGRRLPDGSLEFVGRKDAQVKIRGIRIEPGEVEAALGEIDSVREAIVVACEYTGAREAERERGDLRLVAYVVTRPPRPSANELRGLLQKKLPEPMIPSAFVFLDALPLTPTGKVNRRALPEPSADNPEQEKTFEAPRTPVEEMVAGIWSQVLGLEQVGGQSAIGVHDNFFDLGGHSLLATQIVSRLGHVFQIELPLRELFDSPTVADLAKRIEAIRSLGQAHTAPVVAPLTRRAELARLLQRRLQKSKHAPLSFAQQRLWFLSQLEPHSIAYHLANATRITGPLNIKAIEQSVNAIIQRHGTLRTTFVAMEGQPVQVIAPSLTLALPVIDLSQLAATERETQVQRLAAAEAQRPFDLAAGPLLRCTLLRLAENEHVLLLTMHHIVSDGWSMGVFIREMVLLYQAFTNGQPSPLPELPIQYADYAAWQREWLQGEALEQQVTYWKHQLAGVPVLELPTDRPRPAKLTYQGTTLSFQLSESLKTALQALCRREGVTLFMTLLAGFQTLLSRYTGQVDIAVGSPIANRNRSEIEGLIGFFVNTLVLRANLSGHLTFRQLLGQVRGTTLEAYMHQDLPFERLVEALQPARDLGHQPLFQVMFILQNAPRSALELEGLTFSRLEMEGEASKFDLTLALTEMPQGLRGVVEYNTDLFEASTIVRLVGHFQTLLEGIVADSDRRLSDLPLLTEAEEHQLLVERNDTWADYPRNRCIHELIEDQVKQTPDAVALVFDPPASRGSSPNQHLTYQELDARANQLAHRLQELGVGPEVLTGVCMQRSAEMVVGLYGILKAGGAYVPLDPTFPPERLAFMLADAQVPVLLTQERLRESLPKFPGQVICLDEDEKNLSFAPQVVESRVDARHLAYVIYTSGSTGKPKGVQICHQAVVNFLEAMRQRPGFAASDTLLSVTTLSFDIAGLELYLPLSCGGRVVIARQEDVVNGARLAELIAENNVTVMQATPATWRLLIQSGWCGDERLSILCGGEAFPRELAQALVGRVKAVWNMYGPTETTVWSAIYPMQAGSGAVPIGQPVANTQIYLLDGHLKPVLVGVPGELYIGGEGVARGYLNHPDLTAERFIPNPYARMRTDGGTPGARPENFTLYPSALRLYRTGDLARYLPDGNLEFLGRLDHQVKVRGFRIELGEIEATLAQHPAIREAVVVARDTEHDLGNQQLVAYLVPRENTPSVNELRRFLQDKLPAYMVPSAFVALDALPLTPSGKVNRRALPAPDLARPELDTTYAAPRNPTEEMLAGIWSQVLHLERVGIHDNFFDLGGHSLLATQVMSRVRDIFLVELPLRTLFESPTVAGLSEHIEVPGREECGLSALRLQSDVSENRPAVGVDQMSDQEVSVLLGKLLG